MAITAWEWSCFHISYILSAINKKYRIREYTNAYASHLDVHIHQAALNKNFIYKCRISLVPNYNIYNYSLQSHAPIAILLNQQSLIAKGVSNK